MSLTAARSVALVAGFNFVGWTGPELTPLADAIAGIRALVRSTFLWDPGAQAYLIYFHDAPAGLNTLDFFLTLLAAYLDPHGPGCHLGPARKGRPTAAAGGENSPATTTPATTATHNQCPPARPRSVAAGLRGPRPMA